MPEFRGFVASTETRAREWYVRCLLAGLPDGDWKPAADVRVGDVLSLGEGLAQERANVLALAPIVASVTVPDGSDMREQLVRVDAEPTDLVWVYRSIDRQNADADAALAAASIN